MASELIELNADDSSMQLPLPRSVDRISCSCKIDERMASFVSDFDAVRGVLHAKLRTRNPKPSKSEYVIQGGASLQYVTLTSPYYLWPL